ncbi:MAG: LysM peptidoglycan-binding domain-containing protein [Chloroflexota bacterium]
MYTKMKRMAAVWSVLLVALMGVAVASAQTATCTAIVENALTALEANCGSFEPDRVCYGNFVVDRVLNENRPANVFSRPADTADVSLFRAVSTGPFDAERNEWGIAAVQVTPDAAPTATLYVLLGNVAVRDESDARENRGPMEAISFFGRPGAPNCTDAPSALVIMTPSDATTDLTVNGMDIASSGALVTLTGTATGGIILTVHEGIMTTAFPPRVLSAGESVEVTLDDSRVVQAVSVPRPATMEELALAVTVTRAVDAIDTGMAPADSRMVAAGASGTYTVQRGDNLFRIALNNGTCVSELARANNIPASQVRNISIGASLTIPDGSTCGRFVNDVPVGATTLPAPSGDGTVASATDATAPDTTADTGDDTTTTMDASSADAEDAATAVEDAPAADATPVSTDDASTSDTGTTIIIPNSTFSTDDDTSD